jgi:hypothetical protein
MPSLNGASLRSLVGVSLTAWIQVLLLCGRLCSDAVMDPFPTVDINLEIWQKLKAHKDDTWSLHAQYLSEVEPYLSSALLSHFWPDSS